MTERYEHLRAMRRMHRQQTREIEIMIESGMHGWMKAWASYGGVAAPVLSLVEASAHTCCDADVPATPSPISGTAHGEAVGILSAMVWNIVKENSHVYNN